MTEKIDIGVIGGSGLYEMEGIASVREVRVDTPFGSPSDSFVVGELAGRRVAFLPRHARGHRLMPTNVPFRANIFALKAMGASAVISVSAVGSLKEEIKPLDMVVPDQIIDRTRQRAATFFSDGLVAHVAMADPFCARLSGLVLECAKAEGVTTHNGGTYIAMEGPQFSTRAESKLYRSWGASVIGMTAMPEAKLAREAEMCYALLACATDYDCWHPAHDSVTVEMIIGNLMKNVERSKRIVKRAVERLDPSKPCTCHHALATAIVTSRDRIPAKVKKDLAPLVGKYLK
ncbi:MAG: S-methyl-5'-thioadenosine phosphorylase [Chloroflexi bacterium]|nr:S-methyl-5'-thioadenosine phosphorylase [Chloroflexota bacterium]